MISSLDLESLRAGTPGITPVLGGALLEACLVCFDDLEHFSGVNLIVSGDSDTQFPLAWSTLVTDQMRRSWNDEPFTTEQAAYGIAALLIPQLIGLTIVERSRRGEGFDFWLGTLRPNTDGLFDVAGRLEVSGIRKASSSEITSRVNLKRKQVLMGEIELPTYVMVVEFGRPEAKVSRL